jgi:ribosome maturation factor RimP
VLLVLRGQALELLRGGREPGDHGGVLRGQRPDLGGDPGTQQQVGIRLVRLVVIRQGVGQAAGHRAGDDRDRRAGEDLTAARHQVPGPRHPGMIPCDSEPLGPLSSTPTGGPSPPAAGMTTAEQEVEMARSADRDSLLALLRPVVEGDGLDLEDVVVTPAGKRRLLRVVVDRDGGLGLDTVAAVSTAVSKALDDSDVMGGAPYVLEVTSPGVDRPLTEPRHWRRNLTRLVTVSTAEATTLEGRLTEVDDEGIGVDVDGAVTRLPWDRVSSGRVRVEFNRREEG